MLPARPKTGIAIIVGSVAALVKGQRKFGVLFRLYAMTKSGASS